MSINDIDTKSAPTEKQGVEVKTPETVSPVGNSAQELADLFEIEKADYGKMSPKINTLLDWAKSNTSEGEDIRWTLRRLETKLGTPPMGTSKLAYMAEYAYLWLQNNEINKKLDNYALRR